MQEQIAIQKLLQTKLAETQHRNPGYSLRSYSKKLGVHVGALSHILNGKRRVSRELAERITRKLLLDPQSRSEILALFPEKRKYAKSSSSEAPESRYLELTASQFKTASEWEHFAVMSLVKCEGAKNSAEWIARRLRITESRARQVVERLLQLGLIELDSNGNLTRSKKSYRTPDDYADEALKKHHDETFELARESLYRDSISERDMTTVTMAVDPKKMSTAKELIRKFQDDLSELLESGHQTEVYRLSVQLFPLTQIGESEK